MFIICIGWEFGVLDCGIVIVFVIGMVEFDLCNFDWGDCDLFGIF